MYIKKILLFALIVISIKAQAQFPGKHPELLLNKEVKVKPLSETFKKLGYRNFHKNSEMKILDKPIKEELLVDKIFKVTDVTPFDSYGVKKYIIKIESGKDIYFYEYDSRLSSNYSLEVIGGLTFPEGFYCDDLKTETDKFTGELRVNTPVSDGISFLKVTKGNSSTYFMSVVEAGATPKVGAIGLILLLTNGKRIEKPTAPIDVKVNTGARGYLYSAFITLTPDDIKLLTENLITNDRLYVFDGIIKNGQKISEYLKCLIK